MKLRHSDQLEKRDVRPVSLFRILLQRMDYVSFCLLTEDPSVTKISAQYHDLYRSQKKNLSEQGNALHVTMECVTTFKFGADKKQKQNSKLVKHKYKRSPIILLILFFMYHIALNLPHKEL